MAAGRSVCLLVVQRQRLFRIFEAEVPPEFFGLYGCFRHSWLLVLRRPLTAALLGNSDAASSLGYRRLALSLRSPTSQDRASSSIPRLAFAFLVIVIDSPLFECSRNQDGELELIEVSNSEFLFSAHIPDYIGCSVKVITKEHLPDFAQWTKNWRTPFEENSRVKKPMPSTLS